MDRATEHNCGACSSPEVQALLCELLDESTTYALSLIHISEPTRQCCTSRMPSSA